MNTISNKSIFIILALSMTTLTYTGTRKITLEDQEHKTKDFYFPNSYTIGDIIKKISSEKLIPESTIDIAHFRLDLPITDPAIKFSEVYAISSTFPHTIFSLEKGLIRTPGFEEGLFVTPIPKLEAAAAGAAAAPSAAPSTTPAAAATAPGTPEAPAAATTAAAPAPGMLDYVSSFFRTQNT